MRSYLVTFRSVTPAQRGEAVLRRAGLDCALRRTPGFLREQGCGYSLWLRPQDLQKAAELLQSNRITFQKIYLRRENGSFEEVRL